MGCLIVRVVLLLHAYSVVAHPAGRPHFPDFLSSVDGDVDNYTSNVVGTIPKWLKATKFNNGTNSVCDSDGKFDKLQGINWVLSL